jgi:hypothetical protein
MAATKTDPLAAKQAKQKKILIALSIVLVAVLAIQLPRIMGGSKGSSEAAPAADATAAPGTTDPAAAPAPTVAAAQTAPTTLAPEAAPQAGQAQLASFSLFETKDPFVQQVEPEDQSAGAGGAGGSTKGSGDGAIAKGAGGSGGKQAPAEITNATISVNGDAQAVSVKESFPADEPMFVLASLTSKVARIGIAGGSLKNGKTVPLGLGKSLTLVDTATGARYTLKLLYVGDAPEKTASFTKPKQSGDAAGDSATGAAE